MEALPQESQFDSATRRSVSLSSVPAPGVSTASIEAVERLQSQIRQAQGARLESRKLPTHPSLQTLLPTGALQAGSSYSVENSNSITMAMLAGPSAAGAWCGVVGVPDFNVEAAAQFGIELSRLVLIPRPGANWLGVSAALIDIVSALVINPPKQPSAGQVARLSARLRQREAVLICQTPWPSSEAELRVAENSWQGIGQGYGQLGGQTLTVAATWRSRRHQAEKRGELQLPGSAPQNNQPLTPIERMPVHYPPLTLAVGK